MWIQLPETLLKIGFHLYATAKLAFIWMDDTKWLLRSRPKLGFDLSYFCFLLQILYSKN